MQGRAKTRGSNLLPICKKAHTLLENDGNYYCYGMIDLMYDAPIEVCEMCKANIRNIEEKSGIYEEIGGERNERKN